MRKFIQFSFYCHPFYHFTCSIKIKGAYFNFVSFIKAFLLDFYSDFSINFRSFSLVSKTFLERLQNFSFKNFYFSFSLKFLCEQVKMFRIIALVFVIARSSAYAYEDDHHDEYSPWEFIFPDEVVT